MEEFKQYFLIIFIFLYICLVLFGNAIFNKYGDYIIFMCYIWSIIYCLFIYIAAFFIVLYGFNCVFDFCFNLHYPDDGVKFPHGKFNPDWNLISKLEFLPFFSYCDITSASDIMKKVYVYLDQAEALVREITQWETVVELDKETLLRKKYEAMDIMRDCLDIIYALEISLSTKGIYYFTNEITFIGSEVKLMLLKLEHTQYIGKVFYDSSIVERLILFIREDIRGESVDIEDNRYPFYLNYSKYEIDGFNEYLSKKYTFVRSDALWVNQEADLNLGRIEFLDCIDFLKKIQFLDYSKAGISDTYVPVEVPEGEIRFYLFSILVADIDIQNFSIRWHWYPKF